ncbi:MAG TPA: hypothetical protein VGY77_01350, partial [Gemmataceae bacterium]|nr:hypothetical protein [Gemmataceae bacterium]
MRQRRHVLQVSTFPFLAVLLCAMGSLILLLLVIDRRAKVVARAKALQAVHRLEEEENQVASARMAELEYRNQAQREEIEKQKIHLVDQIQQVDREADTAGKKVHFEQSKIAELQKGIQGELAGLVQKQAENQDLLTEAGQIQKKTRETSKELARLSSALLLLEQTVATLNAAKKKDAQVYSVVPYKGPRGDNRRPLYLECTHSGIIFHPDRLTLEGAELDRDKVRNEVEKRIARRRSFSNAKEETLYLLMLVRPDGIRSYYSTMADLEGLKVDFGYEFIEADWVLDFPEKDETPVQPWMIMGKPVENQTTVPLPVPKALSGPANPPSGGVPSPSQVKAGVIAQSEPLPPERGFQTGSNPGVPGLPGLAGEAGKGLANSEPPGVPGLPGLEGITGKPGLANSGTTGAPGLPGLEWDSGKPALANSGPPGAPGVPGLEGEAGKLALANSPTAGGNRLR